MIKSNFKILILIGRCFILAVGIGALIMSLLFVNIITKDFDTAGLVASLVFSMLAMAFIYVGLDAVKAVTVDPNNKILKVSYLGIYIQVISQNEILGFTLKPFTNKLGTFRGTLIQTKKNKQVQFSELDYQNYADLEDGVKELAPFDNNIQI
ncbi:hypothetical protein, partial [Pontibacter sp. BAB1700]|uniref:hypothetical protein n=1 Tax=Pontibacter sp. BAB1700 TaxID=1144253 RepID=UPI00026BD580